MHWRNSNFSQFIPETRWLEPEKAENAYRFAIRYDAKEHYGLNVKTVSSIERIALQPESLSQVWLAERWPSEGTVQVVFGRSEVCVLPSLSFVRHWQDLFYAEDALILHNTDPSILFYYHEGEIEYGRRMA